MGAALGRRGFFKRRGTLGVGAWRRFGSGARLAGRLSRTGDSLFWPHGVPGRWFNPWWPRRRRYTDLLRWKLICRNEYAALRAARAPEVPEAANDGAYLTAPEGSTSITWVGHSTFIVKDGPDTFLTDPHFGPRAFCYRRHRPPGAPMGKIPGDAFCLLSHNHYDHMDEWTVARLPASAVWYVPMGLAGWFRARGRRAVALDWWQSVRHGRWRLTCLPAQHWSNRAFMGVNTTLWCAWMIESEERRFFFGGDSGYFHGYREFGRRFGSIDVAFLPVGGYAPRWMMRYPHLNPAEAWRAFGELGARWLVPMHWGTFDLTDEPIDEPPRALRRAVAAAAGEMHRVRFMAIGERWRLE